MPSFRHPNVHTVTLLALILQCSAWPSPAASNGPNGTITDESDGTQVWCQPTRWYDVVWFIFTNFILHALSVRSLPGEKSLTSTVFKFCCFLVPYTGVRRGLCLILRASNLAGNDLQSAASANALCMVIRSPEWRPSNGQVVEGCTFKTLDQSKKQERWKRGFGRLWTSCTHFDGNNDPLEIDDLDTKVPKDILALSSMGDFEVALKTTDLYMPRAPRSIIDTLTRIFVESYRFRSQRPTTNLVDHDNTKIHGVCQLAPGYTLSYVPIDVKIYSRVKHHRTLSISRLLGMNHMPNIQLASTHDVPRILFSLIQTGSGGYSLYKARGTQIERYGYAAFGLTVLPYMMVSIVNLVGSLLTSEYEAIYMVHSKIMDEMTSRGGLCDGVVGTIERPEHQTYIYVDGEEETIPQGTRMQFSSRGGELQCKDVAEKATDVGLRIAMRNSIEPVKDIWLWQKWSRTYWTSKKKHDRPLDFRPTRLLCVPSHLSFTRLPRRWPQTCLNTLSIILLILSFGVPYLVIGLLSGFRLRDSTATQRTFTLNWLICGQLQGYAVSLIEAATGKRKLMRGFIVIFVSYGSYSIMGLVAVVQEMLEFGTCKALS